MFRALALTALLLCTVTAAGTEDRPEDPAGGSASWVLASGRAGCC